MMSSELEQHAKNVDSSAQRQFSIEDVRKDFPILAQEINGRPLVYLDNAATTQKPQSVIDAISSYYTSYNSNVHRGAHTLATRATQAFEDARQTVARFINAKRERQVIWTKGCTEGMNLIAYGWGDRSIKQGDVILVSELEHHANIVPWQLLAQRKGAQLQAIALDTSGQIDLDSLDALLEQHKNAIKLISVSHVSNALGCINPVDQIIKRAKSIDALTVIDGAQAIAHLPVDVQELDCDFYLFSGHKLYGPTGIGVLYGRESILETMQPYQSGGEMIEQVSFEGTTFNGLPFKFEAGTPHIEGAVGLAAAIRYLNSFDKQAIYDHEQALFEYLIEQSASISGLRQIGPQAGNTGVFSFLLEGSHPSDIGMLLDEQGVAIRTGHHCAQPLMHALDLPGTARASLTFYNNRQDIDRFIEALSYAQRLFG